MNDIACIIFDCDGTLVDSERLGNGVLAQMATELGHPLSTEEATERFRGVKLGDSLDEISGWLGRELPDTFVAEFRRRSADAYQRGLLVIPGAIELVSSLTIPFCVASSGPRAKIELSLSLTGLLSWFEGRIFSSYDIGTWKPEPGLFLHAAHALGFEPSRCLVIEDSWPGVTAGIAAGMQVIAYQPEATDPRIPAEIPVIRHLSQVRRHLDARMHAAATLETDAR